MAGAQLTTQQAILHAGQQEFLEKGFQTASLRSIVKAANVTTGAFYGYYKSKEELFAALVDEPASVFMGKFKDAQQAFSELSPAEQQENMGKLSGECMDWMVCYVYENLASFQLLLCCAEGTKYENLIHEMVEIEVKATHDFIAVLRESGKAVPDFDPQLEHILISGMFSAFFEMVIHEMPQKQAQRYIKDLRAFYTAGWEKIMGL